MNVSRRQLLGGTVGLAVTGLVGNVPQAFATPEDVAKKISDFTGGADVTQGKIKLDAPEIAENGNSVPIKFSVESPMSDDNYVQSVVVLAEGNPNTSVATFHFTPACGEAAASTRMRLAKTQNVVVVAKMSDGSHFSDTRNVKVTIGGCGG